MIILVIHSFINQEIQIPEKFEMNDCAVTFEGVGETM